MTVEVNAISNGPAWSSRRPCGSIHRRTDPAHGDRRDRIGGVRVRPGAIYVTHRNPISSYRSGRSPDWLKMKNPAAPAVKREDEEDWGRR